MASVYEVARKQHYRVTLDMEVLGDFDPHQIDWNKLFDLEGGEHVRAYVEDLDTMW
jgi:hypothetical protein